MERKMEVLVLGEILIDFLPVKNMYKPCPGGAPANVSVALSRLGIGVSFISKVGKDFFGKFLLDVLKKENVNTENVFIENSANTGIAFVTLSPEGERSFLFYRNPSADMLLSKKDIKEEPFKTHKLFHFGSLSLSHKKSFSATLKALKLAKKNKLLISFDPNIRLSLWRSEKIMLKRIFSVLKYVNILKMNKEEALYISGEKDIEKAAEKLFNNRKLIVITLGSDGCYYKHLKYKGYVKGYKFKVIDTTGAGDGFMGGLIYGLIKSNMKIENISQPEMEEILKFANKVGGLVVTKKGAMSSLPFISQLKKNER